MTHSDIRDLEACRREVEFTEERLDSGDPRFSKAWLRALRRVEQLLPLSNDDRRGFQLAAAIRYSDVVAGNLALNAAIAIRDAGKVPAFDTDPLRDDSVTLGGPDAVVSVSVRHWNGRLSSLTIKDWPVTRPIHSQVDLALLGELTAETLAQMAPWAPIVAAAPNANQSVLRAAGAYITVDPVTLEVEIVTAGHRIWIGRLDEQQLGDHQAVADAIWDLFGAPVDVTVTTAEYVDGFLLFKVNGETIHTIPELSWVEADELLRALWGNRVWLQQEFTVLQIIGR
jgi:hypothetical protein